MFARRLLIACLLPLLVTPAATAAPGNSPEKVAVQGLAKAGQKAVATFKASAKSAQQVFLSKLAAFDKGVKGGGDVALLAATMVQNLDGMQSKLRDALQEAYQALGDACQEELSTYADGQALAGQFPKGFYAGDGSTLDGLVDKLQRANAKVLAKVGKRLAKSAKIVEKTRGWSLSARLFPAMTPPALGIDEDVDYVWQEYLDVDLLVSLSDLAVAGDGVLWVGGTSPLYFDDDSVFAEVFTSTNLYGIQEIVPAPGGRYLGQVKPAGDPLPEGQYALAIVEGQSGEVRWKSMGVR